MATTRLHFTKSALAALQPPPSGRLYVYDSHTPNLALCILTSGRKTFYRYGRIDGRPTRFRLGPFPELTVKQAREMCARATAQVADGHNPHTARKQSRQAGRILGDCWFQFVESHAKPKLAPKTVKEYSQHWDRHLDQWADIAVADITHEDVLALHARLGAEVGRHTANRVVALLSSICTRTRVQPNPAAGIEKFPERSRERRLTDAEVRAVAEALRDSPSAVFADFVLLALFTGQRRKNVLRMRWDQIDLRRHTWHVPRDESKSGEQIVVHLPSPAVAVLKERKALGVDSPWVLPGREPGDHYKYPDTSWRKFLTRAGLSDLRPHDLRRTLASFQADAGASLLTISKSLGQKTTYATMTYARVAEPVVQQSVDEAAAAIALAMRPRKRKRTK